MIARLAFAVVALGFAGHGVVAVVESGKTKARDHRLPWPLYCFCDFFLKLPVLRRPLPIEVRFLGPAWKSSVLE